MGSAQELLATFQQRETELLEQFFEFLRIESISSEAKYYSEMLVCVDWLVSYLDRIGFRTERWECSGPPVVFAEWNGAGPDADTVLIYNHYDVQPVDPLHLWHSPPFEPTIRNGEIYARGAVDDKGQCFFVLAALEHLFRTTGRLPCNVKLIIEGEEETSSIGLSELLPTKAAQLKADHLFIVDVGFRHPTAPAVTLGVRGIVSFSVEIIAANTDVHSGVHGGIMVNPLQAAAELLARLHDSDGKVAIPGFYDAVIEPTSAELADLDFTFDEAGYQKDFDTSAVGAERGVSPLEASWLRPRLEINGIGGGYFGDGFKTVIPGRVSVKLSCRLVPNQQPNAIGKLVKSYLEQHCPRGVRIEVHESAGGIAVRTSSKGKAVRAAAEAISEIVGYPCTNIMTGGSIPIIAELARASEAEVVLMGYALPEDNLHAPNEHFGVDRIFKGAATMVLTLSKLGS